MPLLQPTPPSFHRSTFLGLMTARVAVQVVKHLALAVGVTVALALAGARGQVAPPVVPLMPMPTGVCHSLGFAPLTIPGAILHRYSTHIHMHTHTHTNPLPPTHTHSNTHTHTHTHSHTHTHTPEAAQRRQDHSQFWQLKDTHTHTTFQHCTHAHLVH